MTHIGPHFLFLQGAHDKGTLFLFRTTRNCPSGELIEVAADGGVGGIVWDMMVKRMLEKPKACD